MTSITRIQSDRYSHDGEIPTLPPASPGVSSTIWISLEARRRAAVYHMDAYIARQRLGPQQEQEQRQRQDPGSPTLADLERSPECRAGTVICQTTEDSVQRYQRFGCMVAYDSLTSDLVILDVILDDVKKSKVQSVSKTYFALFLLSIISYETPVISSFARMKWMEYILVSFWSASMGFWTYSASGYWCTHSFQKLIQSLVKKLEMTGDGVHLNEEDRSILTGQPWKWMEFSNAFSTLW